MLSEYSVARLAQRGVECDLGDDVIQVCAWEIGQRRIMEELAAGLAMADHAPGTTPNLADAAGAGQSGRTQDTGDGPMDVQSRDHAVIHTAFRVVAEHG